MSHRQTIPKLKTYYGYACRLCGHEPWFSTFRLREIGYIDHRHTCMGTTGPMPEVYRTMQRIPAP